MLNKKEVTVLSLGAGVQSSTLAMLAEDGKIPRPDFAIFADTMREPEHVYEYLKYLQNRIKSFPIYITSKGDLGAAPHKVPFFIKNKDGSVGMGWRQCTADFKIRAVDRKVREVLGYQPRQRMKHLVTVQIGISTDEMQRMKDPREKWKRHVYPLIELKMSRERCLEYYENAKLPAPPRSACYFCPYKSKREWRDLRDNYPEDWKKAIEFDDSLRAGRFKNNLKGEQFVVPACKPLRDYDLSFTSKEIEEREQLNFGFANECEGMCGI